ncbi:outer membrane protein [Kaistia terrae]|uniref:Outer membrane protein n=1 Tax=Kaistia terrae TaxID=537017 RepID=A0ABW0PUS1_9HYPH|nr:outer membrane protein [Kaistia terrae]MCX5577086.1 porin family protein [Kaistia terrae]
MKYSLLMATAAASVLAMSLGGAQAADLTYEPAPVIVAPAAFNWTGFYAGVHAGYAWGSEDDNQSVFFPNVITPADSFDADGFLGGVHAGYNWQMDQFVFGVEGDIDYADISGDQSYSYLGGDVTGNLSFRSDWQGSARLRAGYAFDNFLIYATGGIAFASGKLSSYGFDVNNGAFGSDDSNTHVGWTIGAGAEYAFSPNWIARAEVRYSDFDNQTYNLYEGSVDAGWDQTAVTVGLSYKF